MFQVFAAKYGKNSSPELQTTWSEPGVLCELLLKSLIHVVDYLWCCRGTFQQHSDAYSGWSSRFAPVRVAVVRCSDVIGDVISGSNGVIVVVTNIPVPDVVRVSFVCTQKYI